jgi:ankyrin repeat protein
VGPPARRAASDFYFDAPFLGATPFWLAARFAQPDVMRLLAQHGADPFFVQNVDYYKDGTKAGVFDHVVDGPTTTLMAAVGMPRGAGFAYEQAATAREREALALESVKVAVELGVDLNAVNASGRTALDGARSARYNSIVEFLSGVGARPGAPAGQSR